MATSFVCSPVNCGDGIISLREHWDKIKRNFDMKKKLATLLIVSVLSVSLTSCTGFGGGKKGGNTGKDDNTSTSTSSGSLISYTLPKGKPSRDLSLVDAFETFDDLYIDEIKEPWGVSQNLRMVSGNVDNYFVYFALDGSKKQINENLNFISTVTQPSVKAYALEDDPGYIVYEVEYDQIFPVYSREPSYVSTSFFSYHNVGFVDYYTGTEFPAINLSTQIDSFGVTGNVIYKGSKYHIGYYEFRTQEIVSNSTKSSDNGYVILQETIKIHSVSYFIVPEFYNGLLMCVFVANDTNTPLQEIMDDNTPYFLPPSHFGDDENPDDYVFYGITAPK